MRRPEFWLQLSPLPHIVRLWATISLVTKDLDKAVSQVPSCSYLLWTCDIWEGGIPMCLLANWVSLGMALAWEKLFSSSQDGRLYPSMLWSCLPSYVKATHVSNQLSQESEKKVAFKLNDSRPLNCHLFLLFPLYKSLHLPNPLYRELPMGENWILGFLSKERTGTSC